MEFSAAEVAAGHAPYTKDSLKTYDAVLHGLLNRYVYRCPKQALFKLYQQNVTANHLDVGVATGLFLDRCKFPSHRVRLGLLDIKRDCLEHAARRLTRYAPIVLEANILEPLDFSVPPFESVGLVYLLHCLPGNLRRKAVVFDNLRTLTAPRARVFGATLLQGGVERNWACKKVMDAWNARGYLSNLEDSMEVLKAVLSEKLLDVKVETRGSAALFTGVMPD
jgi:hypothetical protein